MSKLKIPSLQHMARNWQSDSEKVADSLIRLVKNSPTFSYDPIYDLVRDMLVLNVPYEDIERGVTEKVKRQDVKDNFLTLLPLVKFHFAGVRPTFVHRVTPRIYSASRDLAIPFRPPLIYGSGGKLYLPWFSFWRSNPLSGERLLLFASIVKEILSQDSDLEDCEFSILDFSAPLPGGSREVNEVRGHDLPNLSKARRQEMIDVYAQGVRLARERLIGMDLPKVESLAQIDPRQVRLF